MVEKSVLDRIRDSLATTGAGLQEEVKRQYSHECGHLGMAGISGFISGDGIGIADLVLRESCRPPLGKVTKSAPCGALGHRSNHQA